MFKFSTTISTAFTSNNEISNYEQFVNNSNNLHDSSEDIKLKYPKYLLNNCESSFLPINDSSKNSESKCKSPTNDDIEDYDKPHRKV